MGLAGGEDYKELPSEKIKQERNHKFIKVPNLDHLIKARNAAEYATRAATLLFWPRCRSPVFRGGTIVFRPQWWG